MNAVVMARTFVWIIGLSLGLILIIVSLGLGLGLGLKPKSQHVNLTTTTQSKIPILETEEGTVRKQKDVSYIFLSETNWPSHYHTR